MRVLEFMNGVDSAEVDVMDYGRAELAEKWNGSGRCMLVVGSRL
jgi:hypothetical protein